MRCSFQVFLLMGIFVTFLTFSCRGTGIEIDKHTKKTTEPRTVPTAYIDPNMKIYRVSDGTEISQRELLKDANEASETTHTVRVGETCNTIAKEIGTTVEFILQNNPQLKNDCANLNEGYILTIPKSQQTQSTATETVKDEDSKHIVQAGDTCGQIAKTYAVTLNELLTTNGLTEENCQKLQIGVVLAIP